MSAIELDDLIISNVDFLRYNAFKFIDHKENAEDLVQETLCRALSKKDRYSNGSCVRAWLYTIMRNIFINYYHKSQKYNSIIREKYLSPDFYRRSISSVSSSTSDLDVKVIITSIHALPNVFKKCFLLHIEGYKYTEISIIIQEPVGTVKSRIHFARRLLRSSIDSF